MAESTEFVKPRFLTDANEALDELKLFVSTARAGLTVFNNLTFMRDSLREAADLGLIDKFDPPDDSAYEQYATSQLHTDMPYLYSIATVRLVTILESMVSDACVEILTSRPDLRQRDSIRRLQGPIVEFAAASPGAQAEYIVEALAEGTKAKLKTGLGRFEAILDAVGLGGGAHDQVRKIIYELLEVRNVLVHRNGRADTRFIANCAWLNATAGSVVHVTHQMFLVYLATMHWYAVELFCRWSLLQGVNEHMLDASREYQEILIGRLRTSHADLESG